MERRGDWATAAMELRWIAWDKEVVPGEPHSWSRPALPDLPVFSRLLGLARVTPLTIDGVPHELLAWDTAEGGSRGWLCSPPTTGPDVQVHPLQHEVWTVLGGIHEQWNPPEVNWLISTFGALTPQLAAEGPEEWIEGFRPAWEEAGLEVPIDAADYGVVAQEAGGPQTLSHRTTGEVLLFAHDHSYDYVEPLPGCPEYTLYRLNGAPDLASWIETVAGQWLATVVEA